MPGGTPTSLGSPRGPGSPKKRTPIDLSVSPAITKRGSPPKKKLKQLSILLSMRTKSRHNELAQEAEELGLPAPPSFKSVSGAAIQVAPAFLIFFVTKCVFSVTKVSRPAGRVTKSCHQWVNKRAGSRHQSGVSPNRRVDRLVAAFPLLRWLDLFACVQARGIACRGGRAG